MIVAGNGAAVGLAETLPASASAIVAVVGEGGGLGSGSSGGGAGGLLDLPVRYS